MTMIADSFQDDSADETEVKDDVAILADAVSCVMKNRLHPDKSKYVPRFEGQLLASLATLQMICSELREVRLKKKVA